MQVKISQATSAITKVVHKPKRACYYYPQQREQPDESIQPATVSVDLIALQGQADAWNAVVDALLKISPELFHQPHTGEECVIKTIEALDANNKKLKEEIVSLQESLSSALNMLSRR